VAGVRGGQVGRSSLFRSDDLPRLHDATGAHSKKVHKAIDLFTPRERRDLANTLLRAEWGVALEETRVLLLDLALATDEQLLWAFA
jgi:hypothetical protein